MKLKPFLNAFNSLRPEPEVAKQKGYSASQLNQWKIEIIDPYLQAYPFIVFQLIHCCTTIECFINLEQFSPEYEQDYEGEDFILWGTNPVNGFFYALAVDLEDEVVLLEDAEYSIYQFVATDSENFLDALLEAAKLLIKVDLDEELTAEEIEAGVNSAVEKAGGEKYEEFWVQFIGLT